MVGCIIARKKNIMDEIILYYIILVKVHFIDNIVVYNNCFLKFLIGLQTCTNIKL